MLANLTQSPTKSNPEKNWIMNTMKMHSNEQNQNVPFK